jgi:hypothetical protein
MLIVEYKQSGGEKALNQRANAIHNPSLTSINPHLFDLSCLHCAYITKMGYETNLITHYIIWCAKRTDRLKLL